MFTSNHETSQIKCSNCGEVPDHFVYVAEDETSEVKGGRGSANLVAKCKMCGRENSINIVGGIYKGLSDLVVSYRALVHHL